MPNRRTAFFTGVFLITFAILVFQVVQTRILSVIAWYYLAFFAISVAMLGMTAGAVWVYQRRGQLTPETLSTWLSDSALLAAVSMPLSMLVQFSLITTFKPTATSIFAWSLLMAAMTVPYAFAGITVSLALTRSPYPVSYVYGVDLLGAALGCAAVVGILDVLDGPTAIVLAGLVAALAALVFARGATPSERQSLQARPVWRRPLFAVIVLALLIPANQATPYGLTPVMVKDLFEVGLATRTERWNSYSRIVAYRPVETEPTLWAPSPVMPPGVRRQQAFLNIDGAAGTTMPHFDGTRESIDFLKYDLVNLAYHLPGINKSAVIGVGGGRDVLSAHLFGVKDITGVELNSIFVDLHLRDPFYSAFSNLKSVPGLKLEVDDARSWFAATDQSFDLIQMSLIDTWAATGAGAFSLSENGLYTLEGWRAFTRRLTDRGVFTVSRWYNPGDVNESGRMIALALASMMDAGAAAPRRHVFVARSREIATLVLSRTAFTPEQLALLRAETARLGFEVLVDPDAEPESAVLRAMVRSSNRLELDRASSSAALDLTVTTDNRPFFFNQLRFQSIPGMLPALMRNELPGGVLRGNLTASMVLVLIFTIATLAVVGTIVLPLRNAIRSVSRPLIGRGTAYFALIGIGFMFAEISLLQYFGIFLGHPIYAMGVCLFSLILSSGIGSLVSGRYRLDTAGRISAWAAMIGAYLIAVQYALPAVFAIATASELPVRIAIALAVVMPAGFLMGFAFPTGMMLVERIDRQPTPWFWGINGATGVLASVAAVMIGMAFGINVTMTLAGVCYLALIPVALALNSLPSESLS
jgi:MFS family permease